ncbi:uncharacterized protein N7477_006048 [Penicillium maclennaniae]|uniref:uncharacterized protein n=1 Tax=Penicillium maclennaniae TaxID=1343394 RepID=UPI002542505F|nr:uncharacterized protein N7477_006048 [Penicillium maclennaniae]KAJ5670685.1 hypothetical protein N7477_006048 [Penicillium maclennaniae]
MNQGDLARPGVLGSLSRTNPTDRDLGVHVGWNAPEPVDGAAAVVPLALCLNYAHVGYATSLTGANDEKAWSQGSAEL